MDILEKVTGQPKAVPFATAYDAGIAATCLRSLARKHKVKDLNVRKVKSEILVWRGQMERIEFVMPKRHRYVITPEQMARAQVLGVFSEARA